MMFLPFLKTYWKSIAIALAIAIVFGFGYSRGYSHEKAVYDAYRYRVEALAHVAEEHNAEVVKNQVNITENTKKEYANAVNQLKAYYVDHPNVKWMHNPVTGSSEVSSVPDTASESDGNTTGIKLGADGASPLDCASDVLQLLSLQKWIKEQEGNK